MVLTDNIVLRGSFLNHPSRKVALAKFEELKLQKLQARDDRNSSKEATFPDLIAHLEDELREFRAEYAKGDKAGMMYELADIANMTDIIFTILRGIGDGPY